jgi:hypothetical protein
MTEVQMVAEMIGKRKRTNHTLLPITAMVMADPVLKQLKLRVSDQVTRATNSPFNSRSNVTVVCDITHVKIPLCAVAVGGWEAEGKE